MRGTSTVSGRGLMRRSSSRLYPPVSSDDVKAYWYYYTPYQSIAEDTPTGYLISRIPAVLEKIKDSFRPTRVIGEAYPIDSKTGKPGSGVEIRMHNSKGIKPIRVRDAISRACERIHDRGRPIIGILYLTGATKIAFPYEGKPVERFISSDNPGPWRPKRGDDPHNLNRILHLTSGDVHHQRMIDVAVKTNSSVWWLDWSEFDKELSRRVVALNRARLHSVLQSLTRTLPGAEIEHGSDGTIVTTPEGFAANPI